MKQEFSVVDYHSELLGKLSAGPYDFSEMWQKYLKSAGWTEESYEYELVMRMDKSSGN